MMSIPKHLERAGLRIEPRNTPRWRSVLAASTLFALSAAATLRRAAAMQTQGGTPMPGGWWLALHWTPMCGQTWLAAAASFVGMWLVMMIAMMLPVLVPVLLRTRATPPNIANAAMGYFAVWLGVGALVFAVGAPLAAFAMHAPAIARMAPFAAAMVVLVASAWQFTRWKARRLACCGAFRLHAPHELHASAWRGGVRYGLHCVACCGNLMAALVAIGMMNVPAMIAVSAAIAAERVTPARLHAARVVGAAGLGVGLAMLARRLA